MYPTPEEVIEAYEATGLAPRAGMVLSGQHSGCAIGALALQHRIVEPLHFYEVSNLRELGFETEWDVLQQLGFDLDETLDFGFGFDDGFNGIDSFADVRP